MKVYIVRHGISEYNKKGLINGGRIDDDLTPEGIKGIGSIVDSLPEDISKIYTSDMRRAVHTAEIINERFKVDLVKTSEIREIDLGSLSGLSWNEIESNRRGMREKYLNLDYDFKEFGGESVNDVKNRLEVFLKRLVVSGSKETVLVVAHGGIIRLMSHIYGKNDIKEISNGSIHVFEF